MPQSAPPWSESKKRRLTEMVNSKDTSLRASAAANPHLMTNELMWLLLDDDVDVRRAAVKNPAITKDMLLEAVEDEDPGIAAYARMVLENE